MNSSNFDRRSFLKSGILTGGMAILPFSGLKSEGFNLNIESISSKGFISESGIYGKDSYFILGMLRSQGDITSHETNINNIRSNMNYNSQLTYRSNDQYKLDFAKAIIDYFISNNELRFVAKVIEKDNMDLPDVVSSNQLTMTKVSLYNELISDFGLSVPDNSLIAVKSQSPFGPSQFFTDHFQSVNPVGIEAMDGRTSNLLQLVDFLTGNIFGALTGINNPTKVEVNEYLKTQLGVSALEVGTNIQNKFLIIE